MKRWTSAGIILGFFSLAVIGGGAQPTPLAAFMRPKLEFTQRLLESLVLEDFPKLAKNAKALRDLSEAAEWQVLPSLDYVGYSNEFQRITSELMHDAANKDLDGATLRYVQLTMNCVNCHKVVRKSRAK